MSTETQQTKSNKEKDSKKDDEKEKRDSSSSYDPFAANKWQHQYGRYFGFDW